MILRNLRPRTITFLYFLALSLLVIPGVAFAGTGITAIDNLSNFILGAGAFVLFVLVLFLGIKKMWEHHMMGLFVIICVAVLILIVSNTDLIVQLAKGLASKMGLTWTGTTS